jgi:hypothetical protein
MEMPVVEQGKYVRHISFNNELRILMDGKNRQALISI